MPRRALSGLLCLAALAVSGSSIAECFARRNEPPVMASAPARLVGDWLAERDLTHGFGTYWEGALITALAGDRVKVRAITFAQGRIHPQLWVTKPSWYQEEPQFIIYRPGNTYGVTERTVTTSYGPPLAIEHVAGYDIAVLTPAAR